MEVNIHQAKTNLSRLILRAEAGEEVVIARAGKPTVKLVPVERGKPKKFKAGALKGRLFVPDNFSDPDPELEALFYDGPIFPGQKDGEAVNFKLERTGGGKKPSRSDRPRGNRAVSAKAAITAR